MISSILLALATLQAPSFAATPEATCGVYQIVQIANRIEIREGLDQNQIVILGGTPEQIGRNLVGGIDVKSDNDYHMQIFIEAMDEGHTRFANVIRDIEYTDANGTYQPFEEIRWCTEAANGILSSAWKAFKNK
jgi:hypothetical protein